jgi:hypothetical protein
LEEGGLDGCLLGKEGLLREVVRMDIAGVAGLLPRASLTAERL